MRLWVVLWRGLWTGLRSGLWAGLLALPVTATDISPVNEVPLRILATSDLHAHLLGHDYYRDEASDLLGLARTATLIRAARAAVPNTLLVDNGDLLQGSPLGDYMATHLAPGAVHPIYKAMNLLDYDVGNIGNHEFNFGLDFLQRALAGARFPYVSANVVIDDGDADAANDRPLFAPYVLLRRELTDAGGQRHPITIGVLGLVPPQIMQWDRAHLQGRVRALDMLVSARRYVPEMRAQGADLVLLVAHSGLAAVTPQGMDENVTAGLSRIPGIDAIVFGHAHGVFPSAAYAGFPGADLQRGTLNGVPAVMPGFWGSHLGIVDLQLARAADGRWSVRASRARVESIYRREAGQVVAQVASDAGVTRAVAAAHAATVAWMREPVGTLAVPVDSYFARVADSAALQLINAAQIAYLQRLVQGTEYADLPVLAATAPFKSGGRGGPDYYTAIAAGPVARQHVADLYLYPNTLQAVLLSGSQLHEWLEMAAGQFNRIDPGATRPQELLDPDFPGFNFDVIDGVSYRIDLRQPPRYSHAGALLHPDSRRIVDLRWRGEPLLPAQRVLVAVNNYRAGGGGHFPGLDGSAVVIDAPDELRTILTDYLQRHPQLRVEADHNWQFVPLGPSVLLTFAGSPRAPAQGFPAGVERLGVADDGFARFGLRLP